MYVLPYDEKRALFEITRFGEKILEREEAERSLHVYLSSKEIDFSVVETERGVIRMFDSNPIDMQCETNLYNTGERGGSLKPSTGYSFIRSLEHAREITSDLMVNNKVNNNKQTRFSYYDRLLLQVLKTQPLHGKEVFRRLFTNNKVENVLRFLDEKSTRREEIKIFKSLPIKLFIVVAIKDVSWMLWNKLVQIPFVIWMSLFTLLSYSLVGISFVYVFLLLGMVLIGIPHGALDHLYSKDYQFRRNLTFHIIKYLGLGLLVLLLFWMSPLVGLIFFLLYSSWHFGEADFLHWKIKNNLFSFVWGMYFLGGLLISHFNESQLVIREMFVNLTLDESFSNLIGNIWILVGGFFFLFWKQNRCIFYGVLTLILLKFLPLIPAFAVFFIGQHSIHGWTSLRSSLKETNLNLWLKALPFSIGAILLLPLISVFSVLNWGQIFIFFASLSFPHVFFTSKVLKNWQK
jgi:Brp/Blh family beta-carotene 15,15'-monooxygenase